MAKNQSKFKISMKLVNDGWELSIATPLEKNSRTYPNWHQCQFEYNQFMARMKRANQCFYCQQIVEVWSNQ